MSKPTGKFLPITAADGSTVQVRIGQMRPEWNDFLLEVYPERGHHGIVQIMGKEYFHLKTVKKLFLGDAGIEVTFKTYEEWNELMSKLLELYNEEQP